MAANEKQTEKLCRRSQLLGRHPSCSPPPMVLFLCQTPPPKVMGPGSSAPNTPTTSPESLACLLSTHATQFPRPN